MNTSPVGVIETIPHSFAPLGSNTTIELVFHTGGERTHDLALKLALENIKPHRVYIIRGLKPWRHAIREMLGIDYCCSHVVCVDANCLILQNLRPFLDANALPFVGCYGSNRFRGRTPCGVHIMRLDVIRAMRTIPERVNNPTYLLNPYDYLLTIALCQLGFEKTFKNFHILSDYFQRSSDVFITSALWGLHHRTGVEKKHLDVVMSCWGQGVDFDVARHALDHVARAMPTDATPRQVKRYLRELPSLAQAEIKRQGGDPNQCEHIDIDDAVTRDHVNIRRFSRNVKVFGIGLSRTGTHSLTEALHTLGVDTVHYPVDRTTYETLLRGDACFPLLNYYDGITDITSAPYYEDLDQRWPGSKFVLTVRDENSWLHSCRKHWSGLPQFTYGGDEENRVFRKVRYFLEAAVYKCYEFNEERFRRAYRHHVQNVTRYFTGRENDLLVLNIVAGEGYEKLAPFLGMPIPRQPFPHGGRKGKKALVSPSQLSLPSPGCAT